MNADSYVQLLEQEFKTSSVVALRLDMVVSDPTSSQVGARVIVQDQTTDAEEIEYLQHFICTAKDTGISEIKLITDTDVMAEKVTHIEPSPQPQGQDADVPVDLAQLYIDYIACINGRTMKTNLPKYCHDRVNWCSKDLPLDEYRELMEGCFDAIKGLSFQVRDLVVDEEKQQLAVRLEFKGTPVKLMLG